MQRPLVQTVCHAAQCRHPLLHTGTAPHASRLPWRHMHQHSDLQNSALLQALLSSEPKSSSCSLLKTTMRELTALATPPRASAPHGSTVPQVCSHILRLSTVLRL